MRRFLIALAMFFAPLSAQALPADGEWEEFGDPLTTALPTESELGSDWWSEIRGQLSGAALSDWTSALFDPDRREIVLLRPGGHADYGGADSFCVNIDTGAWTRCEPTQRLTNTTEPGYNAATCPWPENGAPAQHTYDGVEYLAPDLYLHTGTPGFCKPTYMSPKSTAFLVDRSTTPWTWIRRDDLKTYVRSMTAHVGSTIILHGSSGTALLDTAGNVLSTAPIKGVIMNGTAQSIAGYTSASSAGGLSTTGFFCVATGPLWVHCTNLNGGVRDIDGNGTDDNDTFGRFLKRPMGAQAGAPPETAGYPGYTSMATLPDGWLALWLGGKRIWLFHPADQVSGDQWAVYEPATGPTDGTSGRTYDKIFWDEQTCTLVGVSNRDEGLWRFNPPEIADCGQELPPEPPCTCPPPSDVTAAPDEGDYGPSPTASLASLALRTDTILADPLDNTPVTGPGAGTDLLTLPEVIQAGWYHWRQVLKQAGTNTPEMDCAVAADGCSLKLIMSQGGGSIASKYEISPTFGADAGQTVRLRFKTRYSCDVLYTDCDPQSPGYKQERRVFAVTSGAGGFKLAAVGEVPAPGTNCDGGTCLGVPVLSHYKQRGFFAGYIAHWQQEIDGRAGKIQGVTNFDKQPGGPRTCTLYDPNNPVLTPWLDPGCHMIEADQWQTYQMEIAYSPNGCTSDRNAVPESHLKVWIADEGQPFELVIDRDVSIACSKTTTTKQLGRVSLDAFMTGKDPAEAHPTGYIWYDSLWVSVN